MLTNTLRTFSFMASGHFRYHRVIFASGFNVNIRVSVILRDSQWVISVLPYFTLEILFLGPFGCHVLWASCFIMVFFYICECWSPVFQLIHSCVDFFSSFSRSMFVLASTFFVCIDFRYVGCVLLGKSTVRSRCCPWNLVWFFFFDYLLCQVISFLFSSSLKCCSKFVVVSFAFYSSYVCRFTNVQKCRRCFSHFFMSSSSLKSLSTTQDVIIFQFELLRYAWPCFSKVVWDIVWSLILSCIVQVRKILLPCALSSLNGSDILDFVCTTRSLLDVLTGVPAEIRDHFFLLLDVLILYVITRKIYPYHYTLRVNSPRMINILIMRKTLHSRNRSGTLVQQNRIAK